MSFGLSSHAALLRALDLGRSIKLCAYTLREDSSIVRALDRAADRGATVSVSLEGAPDDPAGEGIDRANRVVAADLRAHGVRVRMADRTDPRLHLKAAVVDGTAFLDDRNWPEGRDTIVETTSADDVAAVSSAILGRPGATPHLATVKARALQLEAEAVLEAAGDRIDLETESFGASVVSAALRRRAADGATIRLIISGQSFAHATPRERAQVADLARAGIEVRLGGSDEKLCVGGDRGWVGSANATFAPQAMLDWGLQTWDRAILDGLESAFSRDWRTARAYPQA